MSKGIHLTMTQARALYESARCEWAPQQAYVEWMAAMEKLSAAGRRCRDCAAQGLYPHRLGGVVCEQHTPQETNG